MQRSVAVRRSLVTVAAALLIGGGGADAAPVVHTVIIDGFEFHPPEVTVGKGDVVVWLNKDPVPHTATAKSAALDSGSIAASGSFRFTAKRVGRYDYICTLHPTMKGVLVVQ
jgi:plastocyanin